MQRLAGLVVALLAAMCFATSAFAEKRVALVIGNGAYKHAPALANPRNDAEAMAASLKRMKFEVVSGIDLDKTAMERLLRDFVQKLDNADLALVFYAGHGLQVHGRNYFVPVDAKLERETDLAFEAVSLELVQQVLEQTRRTNILILDACRDNPLARNLARSMGTRSTSIGRGLGQAQAGIGTLIVYATQPGNVALDGEGANSPFTTALLRHIETPGLEIRLIVSRVRQAVIESTRDRQVPWDSSSLVGEVYLSSAPKPPPPPQAPALPGAPSAEFETLFWQTIRDSKSIGDFKAYLERWPAGVFAPLARFRIAELERAASVDTKRAEDERKKAGEDQRADAERKAQDEARQETERKRNQADAIARLAGSRLDQAKAVLKQNEYVNARRLADESAALLKEATEISPAAPVVQAVSRDLDAFRRDLGKRIAERVAVLLREARGFIAAKKFDDASRLLDEAERLEPASAAAARRELEGALGRAEAEAKRKAEADEKKRADDEARKKSAEERAKAEAEAKRKADEEKKKSDEAKPVTPDPKKQAQTANSFYAPERKRGLIAFAHKKATLEPGAVAALERLAASLKDQKDYKISLVAAADRTEGAPAELQALNRARLAAVQQWLAARGIAGTAVRTGIGPARGEGPEHRVVSISAEVAAPEKKEEKPASPAPPGAASAGELMRRLAGAEWRGTVSTSEVNVGGTGGGVVALAIILRFREGGRFELTGEQIAWGTASNRQVSAAGSWRTAEGRVCMTISAAAGGQETCYTAAPNNDGSITLSGSGFLTGRRFAK